VEIFKELKNEYQDINSSISICLIYQRIIENAKIFIKKKTALTYISSNPAIITKATLIFKIG